MICLTCALTVLSDMFSASAINLFDLPSEINAKTSRWRRVSSRQGVHWTRCGGPGGTASVNAKGT